MIFLAVIFHIVLHTPNGDQLREYEGMSKDTVTNLAIESGYPFEFISQSSWTAHIDVQRPKHR